MTTIRIDVHFSGRVQGVGFRWTALRVAGGYAVTGFVRNLPDGRVQMVVEGAAAEARACLEELCERMAGYIQGVDEESSAGTGEFQGFQVERW